MTAVPMKGPPIPYGGTAPNGPGIYDGRLSVNSDFALAAALSARVFYGYIITSDGGSHTLSSGGGGKLGFLPGAVTLAQATTSIQIGLAPVDTGVGPPGRASNTANLINFDVSKSWAGNAAHGITATTWYETVMDAGTKTVANGDLIAFAVQLTAWVTTDSVAIRCGDSPLTSLMPGVTNLTGPSTYAAATAIPNMFITFDDGAFGWFLGSQVFSVTAIAAPNHNSGSSPNEYGNLFQFPFPVSIIGASFFGVTPTNGFDAILYSDPLGTPAAQKTLTIDPNVTGGAIGSRRLDVMFPPAYALAANTPVVLAPKPGASNISALYRTLFANSHQVTMNLGTDCYAVNRSSGAFAAQNSGKDRFNFCLLVSAFDDGTGGSSGGGSVNRILGNRILK